MEEVRIFESDDYMEMAEKIWMHFKVNQNCTVKGFVHDGDDIIPKGELVLKMLEQLDHRENVGKGNRRKRYKVDNSVGDFLAQKMFIWEKRVRDHQIYYLIWRRQ